MTNGTWTEIAASGEAWDEIEKYVWKDRICFAMSWVILSIGFGDWENSKIPRLEKFNAMTFLSDQTVRNNGITDHEI